MSETVKAIIAAPVIWGLFAAMIYGLYKIINDDFDND